MNIYIRMISWVPQKTINQTRVASLLEASIESGQFTNYGPNVQRLEVLIRDTLKVDASKAVVAVCNGSVALHVATAALSLQDKIETHWATQSFTFPPSAQGTLREAEVIDIDDDGGVDLALVGEEVGGIIVTNIFGNVVDISKYTDWATKNGKYLVFDNAATPMTFYKGKNSVNYGHAATISFHHTKPLGFGEGGAVIIDKKYEPALRSLINFGIGYSDEYWMREGNNGKMSDLAAAYIIQYLELAPQISKKHRELYAYMESKISRIRGLGLFKSFQDRGGIMPSCFCLIFEQYNDQVRQKLILSGVFCRKYYHPLASTPRAMELHGSILCLPCTVDMKLSDIDRIISIISSNQDKGSSSGPN
jgi:dTDP-4-amino-4,6-dideoxygalactose transaminase